MIFGRFLKKISGFGLAVVLFWNSSAAFAGQADAGAVVINGQKSFPLGWYGLSWAHYPAVGPDKTLMLTESAQHGFNYAMPYYSLKIASTSDVLSYLDTAQSLGVKVMVDTEEMPTYQITSKVNAVKNHPALYGYYVYDEPEIQGIPASQIVTYYNAIKSADPNPNHPVLLTLTQSLADHQDYLAACDIIGRELYNPDQIATIESDIAVAKTAGKSYVAVPPMYSRSTGALVLSTAEEFKYYVFNPISKGAGGIMPFLFEGHCDDGCVFPPAGFRDARVYPTTDLLRKIIPTLLKGSGPVSASLDYWDKLLHGGSVLSWVFAGDNRDAVLVVVNDSNTSLSNMDFTLTGLVPTIITATVLGETRTISLTNGVLTDNFGPHGVHVYRFYQAPGDANGDGIVNSVDLSIVLAAMDTANTTVDQDNDGQITSSDLAIVLANL